MPLRQPISVAELKAIHERNSGNPDITALLWEVKRYHVLMSRFYQLANSIPKESSSLGMIARAALNEMADDPAVQQIIRDNEDLFGQRTEPGDDD